MCPGNGAVVYGDLNARGKVSASTVETETTAASKLLLSGVDVLPELLAEVSRSSRAHRHVAQSLARQQIDSSQWALVSFFEQPRGTLPRQTMNSEWRRAYFLEPPIWIQGNSQGAPTGADAYDDGHFHIESLDWCPLLTQGVQYEIRQHISNGDAVFDVSYSFTYNGYVLADHGPDLESRAWPLFNRTVLRDTTGIAWDTESTTAPTRFRLPATARIRNPFWIAYNGGFVVPHGDHEYTVEGCGQTSNCGTVGIISDEDSHDLAASIAPDISGGDDFVYVYGATSIFGLANGAPGPIVARYWLRRRTSALNEVVDKVSTAIPVVYKGSIADCNLSAYKGYTHVTGSVDITDCPDVGNLDDLSSVKVVGGSLVLRNNAGLTRVDALSSLLHVGGFVSIENCDALSAVDGDAFSSLTSVGGFITVIHNDALVTVDSFKRLSSIGSHFMVFNNKVLKNFGADTFQNVHFVPEWVRVCSNDVLFTIPRHIYHLAEGKGHVNNCVNPGQTCPCTA